MEKIERYLRDELKLREVDIRERMTEFERHSDIAGELATWIETREFPTNGVTVEGYKASEIAAMAEFMDGAEVYDFLVALREEPAVARQYVREGFPRK